ncbi:HlyD family type I secretion periplasmic adaptor subunit [uncultured Alsobacter sp.]|uniref:HlyD family type I secretion periplasmic adaptor subunit n=1 Tax=uncultured Alsobacter sp. TaxID=1748258 RepID=UPI0025F28D95|nr:HlyD family type I secretion periplasmic adaptor subunit [uncultured Alsobacter sp.]
MSDWAENLTRPPRGRYDEARAGRLTRDRANGSVGRLVGLGLGVLVLFFGAIGSWAALAPLDSAVVADGAFEAAGNRKALQHRDGGIVASVLARDGDTVEAGQVLMVLDDSAPKALVASLSAQATSLSVLRSRLVAERDEAPEPVFEPDLLARSGEPAVARILAAQRHQFDERRRQLEGELAILAGVASQQGDQLRGLQAQIVGIDAQAALLRQEADGVRKLFAAGYATKVRLSGLERNEASVVAEQGRLAAQAAALGGALAATGLRRSQLRRDRQTEVADQLRQIEQQAAELEPRLMSARETLTRTVMRAPAAGTVLGLNVFTVGGVIAAGQKVLEIVPADGQPTIAVRVDPAEAERLRAGQTVDVQLTGIPAARRPIVTGHLMRISADRLTDPRSGAAYYEARVAVDDVRPGPGAAVQTAVVLGPGMPAQVIIGTGSRSALQYLVGPLTDQIRRAMREE